LSFSSIFKCCSAFNGLTPDDFAASKFRTYELQPLKDEIAARTAFKDTRKTQLNNYLGSVAQDIGTGDVTSSSGFYGTRFKIINLRLNLLAGTLNALVGSEGGISAQEQSKKLNQDAEDVYNEQMAASIFTAPAAGTKIIHVQDASRFAVSDSVYVMADTQSEISATIDAIDGNMVTLSVSVPKKYRQDDNARLYKVL
jgi:hypothetical protein